MFVHILYIIDYIFYPLFIHIFYSTILLVLGFRILPVVLNAFKVMSTLGDTIIVVETLLSEVTCGHELDILEKELEQIASKQDDITKLGVFKNLVNNLHVLIIR